MKHNTAFDYILDKLPYKEPFLFVSELSEVNDDGVVGSFVYDPNLGFYRGHFDGHPVTPGVILIETMAQIGLVCLGIYLTHQQEKSNDLQVAMTSSNIDYLLPVYPGEKVRVVSNKVYFRFGKLKCEVEMYNKSDNLVCKGIIAGMIRQTQV